MTKVPVEVEDEEGNTTEEMVMLPVDTVEFGTVSYRNTAQPDAPASVAIKPIGNEIMNASWSEVENADGYKVNIYQEQGGSYEDTGMGYSYDAEDIKNGKIKGIAYDAATETFTLDMALTVGGEDIDENGNSTGTSTVLAADKNYKIGVQAYKYLTEDGEKIENSQIYSEETRSNDSYLPAYTPVDIKVKLNTLKGTGPSSAFVEKTVTEEGGVFTCVAGSGDNNTWYLIPSVPEGTNATFTVTRMDTGDEYTATGFTGKEYYIDNKEIIGSVMFEIKAAVEQKVGNETYTDITTKYLLVQKDDTAPMLSLDEMMVYADPETGEYTITGLAEPNSKVCLNEEDYYGNPIEVATADENGRFSYTDKLELTAEIPVYDEEGNPQFDENGEQVMVSVPNELSKLVCLLAADENGNRSAVESAAVTVKPEEYSVTLNTNGGTIGSGKDVKSYVGGQGALLPNENDMTRAGYTFAGWYDNKALTGDPVTFIDTSETGEKSFWAKWDAKTYTVDFDSAGGTEVASKTNAKWDEAVLDGVADPTRSGYRFDGWMCGDTPVTAETTYGELALDDTVSSIALVARWKDNIPPTGEIKVSNNSWKSFFNDISFGLLFKERQTVTITASDNSGDDVSIEYFLSNKELTDEELVAASFTKYTGAFSLAPEYEYVIYAKLTDASGNVSYINSDGIVISSLAPEIIVGNGQKVEVGEKKALSFTSSAEYRNFIRVEVDGNILDGANYTVREGSTIVTLKADYVATLSVGEHTLSVVSRNGTASTKFTVTAKTVNSSGATQTGDNSHMVLWTVLLLVSGCLLTVMSVFVKKRKRSVK